MPKGSLVLACVFLNTYSMILPQCAEIMHAICSCWGLTIGVCLQQLKSGNFNFKLSQRSLALFPDFFELKLASGP